MRKKGFPRRIPVLALGALLCLTSAAATLGKENPFKAQGGGQTNILHGPSKEGLIALDDIGISVNATDYLAASQNEDGFVYLYTQEDGYIPYVIIGKYDFACDNVVDQFTDYMKDCTEDFRVQELKENVKLGDYTFDQVVYNYTCSGYTIKDERFFTSLGEVTYMFGGKEVPELSQFLAKDYVRDIAGSFALLAGGDDDYPEHVDGTRSIYHEKKPEEEVPGAGNVMAPGAMGDLAPLEKKNQTPSQQEKPSGEALNQPPIGQPQANEKPEDPETDKSSKADKKAIDQEPPLPEDPLERELPGDVSSKYIHPPILFTENLAPFKGQWTTFYDDLQVYLPTDWEELEISDFMQEKGILYQAGDTSGKSDMPLWIGVNYGPSGEVKTIEEMYDTLVNYGYEVEGIMEINHLQCISYEMKSHDLKGLMFFLPGKPENVMALVAYNYSMDEDTQSAILCSLSSRS